MKNYSFKDITHCQICGAPTDGNKIIGQRLNQSQGLSPRKKTGISVSVLSCKECKVIYSNPQPIPEDIQDHYGVPPEDYWIPEYFKLSPDYFAVQIEDAKELLDFKPGMKALDIGAGLGKAMLSMDAAGFDSYGFEPSIPFHARAISELKVDPAKLELNTIEDISYEKDSFDFITFGAVFEHLYEPRECLEKSATWLKKGGVLHIEVPSSRWLIARFINLYYKIVGTNYTTHLSPMHEPFHLFEYHINSFNALAKKYDLEIVKCRYDACAIYFFPKVLHPLVRWFMNRTNTGMQLTVYFKKK